MRQLRKPEYATLEHLLLSLIDDGDAAGVMRACDVGALRTTLTNYVDNELRSLVVDDGEDAKPIAGFRRVMIHVQSSGREEVTRANVLVAIFSEPESHAAYFLQRHDMTRYDAVNYIAHGIAKKAGASEAKPGKGAEGEDKPQVKTGGEALEAYCINLNEKAKPGEVDPLIWRMGSTTYKAFRQHFEKDRALVRRFQKIDVNEPTIEDTIKILKGLKTDYEAFHKLRHTNPGTPHPEVFNIPVPGHGQGAAAGLNGKDFRGSLRGLVSAQDLARQRPPP